MDKYQVLDPGWKRQEIWEGSMLASIAHDIFVANNPDFAYKHSWDVNNYITNDGQGSRGPVKFTQDFCRGIQKRRILWRDERSKRTVKLSSTSRTKNS